MSKNNKENSVKTEIDLISFYDFIFVAWTLENSLTCCDFIKPQSNCGVFQNKLSPSTVSQKNHYFSPKF